VSVARAGFAGLLLVAITGTIWFLAGPPRRARGRRPETSRAEWNRRFRRLSPVVITMLAVAGSFLALALVVAALR
jgi:hypothetical protein